MFEYDTTAKLYNTDCIEMLDRLIEDGVQVDSVVTDPPYEIALHGKKWDDSGIAFSADLWERIHKILKPGGFVIAFGAARKFHHLVVAAEKVEFKTYPPLLWRFKTGLPKPMNISNMLDKDAGVEREVVGTKKGSGYTKSNVDHGAQGRNKWEWEEFAATTPEAKEWEGWYYGVNCMKPAYEPIYIGQKEPEGRMVDNIKKYRTGGLNLGLIKDITGNWPDTIFEFPKASKKEKRDCKHPSIKPLELMKMLCMLVTPPNGTVLEPFAGSGTTGEAAYQCDFNCIMSELDSDMISHIQARVPHLTVVNHNSAP